MGRLTLLIVFGVTACIVLSDAASSVGSPVAGKDSASSLASIINILHGKFSLKDLLQMGPLMQTGFKELQTVFNFSPLLQEMVQQAAQNNPTVNVLKTILDGKIPSFNDIIKMAKTKSDSVERTWIDVQHHYPEWLKMEAIMHSSTYNNHANLKKVVEMLVGRKIDENVVKLDSNKYTITELSDFAYKNVLKLAYFFGDNYVTAKQAIDLLNHQPVNFQGVLSLLTKFDTRNFPTTMVTDVHKNPSTNPDSVHFLNDIKTKYPQILAEHDDNKASAAVYDAVTSLLKITDEVFTEAETLGNSQANSAKP